MPLNADSRRRTTPWVSGLAVLLLAGFLVFRPYAWAAQPPGEEAAGPSAVEPQPTGAEPAAADDQPVAPSNVVTPPTGLFDLNNAFALWVAGGWWMVPITFMSLIMVTVCDRAWFGAATQAADTRRTGDTVEPIERQPGRF